MVKKIRLVLKWTLRILAGSFLLYGVYVAIILGNVPTNQVNEVAYQYFGRRGFIAGISMMAYIPGMIVLCGFVLVAIVLVCVALEKAYNWIFKN